MPSKWRIGTSGWSYKHWREVFYPPKLPLSRWLDFYTTQFDTVELNATFYRLPKPETFDNWYQKTPKGFLWSVKASKFITHTKRLKDFEQPLERFYGSVERLKEKIGPILFQLPPSLSYDKDRFIPFCENLDPAHRHTVEVRHPSWIDPPVFDTLKRHNIALCFSDTAGRFPYHEVITADFIYIRLHGSRKLYASEYSEEELRQWAQKIRRWDMETYLYFDNDAQGFAVKNAARLKAILSRS